MGDNDNWFLLAMLLVLIGAGWLVGFAVGQTLAAPRHPLSVCVEAVGKIERPQPVKDRLVAECVAEWLAREGEKQ